MPCSRHEVAQIASPALLKSGSVHAAVGFGDAPPGNTQDLRHVARTRRSLARNFAPTRRSPVKLVAELPPGLCDMRTGTRFFARPGAAPSARAPRSTEMLPGQIAAARGSAPPTSDRSAEQACGRSFDAEKFVRVARPNIAVRRALAFDQCRKFFIDGGVAGAEHGSGKPHASERGTPRAQRVTMRRRRRSRRETGKAGNQNSDLTH